MADDTAKIERALDEQALETHFCEYPGRVKWGGLGYDVGHGDTQWFCHEHRWTDYRMGNARRSYFDESVPDSGYHDRAASRRALINVEQCRVDIISP